MKRLLALGVAGTACIALAGCGGAIPGIVVQGNMNPLYLTTAVTAVVTDAGFAMSTAPNCVQNENKTSYACTGKTDNGQPITASVPYATQASTEAILYVKVGDKTLYNGPITDILLKNAQVGS